MANGDKVVAIPEREPRQSRESYDKAVLNLEEAYALLGTLFDTGYLDNGDKQESRRLNAVVSVAFDKVEEAMEALEAVGVGS